MKKFSTLNFQLSTRKGFTLIEFLIVIVIIGVLATIFMANYLGVRQRARDSKRKSDLRQIQAALELYRYDQGSYPTDNLYSVSCANYTSASYSSLVVGAETYMKKIPCDPSSLKFWAYPPGNYYYNSTGTAYNLGACIENTNDKDPNVSSIDLDTCITEKLYYLTSP